MKIKSFEGLATIKLILAISSLSISLFHIIIPVNIDPLMSLFYWVGGGVYIITDLLFLITIKDDNLDGMNVSFIFDLIIWTILMWGIIRHIMDASVGEMDYYSEFLTPEGSYSIIQGFYLAQLILIIISFCLGFGISIVKNLREIGISRKIKRFCPNCHQKIFGESNFCKKCGLNFEIYEVIVYDGKYDLIECPKCNELIEYIEDFCPNCEVALDLCVFCKKFIKDEDETIKCPKCNSNFHKNELIKWVREKKACPFCYKDISLDLQEKL